MRELVGPVQWERPHSASSANQPVGRLTRPQSRVRDVVDHRQAMRGSPPYDLVK